MKSLFFPCVLLAISSVAQGTESPLISASPINDSTSSPSPSIPTTAYNSVSPSPSNLSTPPPTARSSPTTARIPFGNNDDRTNEVEFILKKMESDVLMFRDEMERVYSDRCNTNTLTECARSNFNDCSSSFRNQICMDKDELIISQCGDGEDCNSLWDKSVSTVSLPSALAQAPFNNPSDPEIIETACYSRLAEPYMVDKYAADEEFWANYNVSPSWTYFGAHNGLFRRIPATHQEQCGAYDVSRELSLLYLFILMTYTSLTHRSFQ